MALTVVQLRTLFATISALAIFSVSGCASLQSGDPVEAFVVGLEPLQGQGLELRMSAKLRIQNPNDAPVDFNGVSIQMNLQGKRFATGVSDSAGTVPRFGETIVEVPVSVSLFRIANQFIGAAKSDFAGKVAYELTGKLSRPAAGSLRFKSHGEIDLSTTEP